MNRARGAACHAYTRLWLRPCALSTTSPSETTPPTRQRNGCCRTLGRLNRAAAVAGWRARHRRSWRRPRPTRRMTATNRCGSCPVSRLGGRTPVAAAGPVGAAEPHRRKQSCGHWARRADTGQATRSRFSHVGLVCSPTPGRQPRAQDAYPRVDRPAEDWPRATMTGPATDGGASSATSGALATGGGSLGGGGSPNGTDGVSAGDSGSPLPLLMGLSLLLLLTQYLPSERRLTRLKLSPLSLF